MTTSIFPSDEVTQAFLEAQGREAGLGGARRPTRTPTYDKVVEIDLSELEPLAAYPHSPGNIKTVQELGGHRGRPGLHGLAAPTPPTRT